MMMMSWAVLKRHSIHLSSSTWVLRYGKLELWCDILAVCIKVLVSVELHQYKAHLISRKWLKSNKSVTKFWFKFLSVIDVSLK